MRFSIIIPTRNNYPGLEGIIASINGLDYGGHFETIITDQSAPKRAVIAPRNGECHHILTDETGVSSARNQGIRRARGDHLIFIDDDATFGSDFLKNMDKIIARYPDYSCICGLILVRGSDRMYSRHMRNTEETVDLDNFNCCMGSAMMINKRRLGDENYYDEQLGIGAEYGGSEESDLVLRLLERNKRVIYAPLFKVYHPPLEQKPAALKRWVHKHYTYGVGRGAMLRKHLRVRPPWALKNYALSLVQPLAATLVELGRFRGEQALRYAASFLGRIKGFISYKRKL